MEIQQIAALITGTAAAAATVWRVIVWGGKIMEGLRCQLRTDMLRVYYRHREEKRIRQYEFQNFEANYAAYRALRGNSFITAVHEEIQAWEIET